MSRNKPYNRDPSNSTKIPVNNGMSSRVWMIILAVVALAGYYVGTQNYQIQSLIAPLFGQKVYSGNVDLSTVEATFRALKANFDGDLDDKKLLEGASRGMVDAAGDQYTVYMNSTEAADFDNDLTGNIGGGIGAEIGLRDSRTVIVRVLDNNPAVRAGLKGGDIITKINDESTDGWTVEQAVAKIRGEKGTTVKIEVLRGSENKEYSITRDTITNPSVYYSIEDSIGIMTISRFDSETASLAKAAARDFAKQNVKGVILDLRFNGGGYVDAAQDVASLWLNSKVVVTERSGDTVVDELKSGISPLLDNKPTAVIINSGSASASEILAGALQDHGRAKIVGETSFGKGSVQKLIDLPDGAQLKVTIAKWYTPNGKNITKGGIEPDVKAAMTQADVDAGRDPQLDAAKAALNL